MIRVLIADDHELFRKGLKNLLLKELNITNVDEASNYQEVLYLINKNTYDIVLLDLSMPGRSGLDILKQIKIDKSDIKTLVLSMYPEEQYAVRVLKAGASGYLNMILL